MKTRRSVLRVSLIILLTVSVLSGGGYFYWSNVLCKLYTVSEGKVYRSAAMPSEKLKKVIQKYSIRTVIDLREARYKDEIDEEHRIVTSAGGRHISIPSKQVPADETVKTFLEIMDDPDTYPVLIHCCHGEGRAVLFSALYRIEYEGWKNDRARRASRLITWGSSFDADAAKGIYLNNYKTPGSQERERVKNKR